MDLEDDCKSFSLKTSHGYPEDWQWWVCTREYAAAEFDGMGLQRLDYLPLCAGDKVATMPVVRPDGFMGHQEASPGGRATKYPLYYYVHSVRGAGWVPIMVLKQCDPPKLSAPVLSKEVFENSHLHRTPSWFQENPQAVCEYIIYHGKITPSWALRGFENKAVEAKLEHYHSQLGLVVTDLSGHQVVTYYPPGMRRDGSKPPLHRQRAPGHTQFSISEHHKIDIAKNFEEHSQNAALSTNPNCAKHYHGYNKEKERLESTAVEGHGSVSSMQEPDANCLILHPSYDWPDTRGM